jgi:hypothetical protein
MKKFFDNKKLWAIIMMFVFAMAIISRASRFFDGPITDEKKFYHILWIVLFALAFLSNFFTYRKLSKQSVENTTDETGAAH